MQNIDTTPCTRQISQHHVRPSLASLNILLRNLSIPHAFDKYMVTSRLVTIAPLIDHMAEADKRFPSTSTLHPLCFFVPRMFQMLPRWTPVSSRLIHGNVFVRGGNWQLSTAPITRYTRTRFDLSGITRLSYGMHL